MKTMIHLFEKYNLVQYKTNIINQWKGAFDKIYYVNDNNTYHKQ